MVQKSSREIEEDIDKDESDYSEQDFSNDFDESKYTVHCQNVEYASYLRPPYNKNRDAVEISSCFQNELGFIQKHTIKIKINHFFFFEISIDMVVPFFDILFIKKINFLKGNEFHGSPTKYFHV